MINVFIKQERKTIRAINEVNQKYSTVNRSIKTRWKHSNKKKIRHIAENLTYVIYIVFIVWILSARMIHNQPVNQQ